MRAGIEKALTAFKGLFLKMALSLPRHTASIDKQTGDTSVLILSTR
jgi:hypothetical protein